MLLKILEKMAIEHPAIVIKEQITIGKVAILMRNIGILKLIKIFPNYLPYMKLSFMRL